MSGVTYDTGMLLAAEANRPAAWALHRRALERGLVPVVPAAVLAQAWRGGPQPMLSRLLVGCEVEPIDEPMARHAGRACARASTSDVVDAMVVVGALARRELVITSDARDLARLATALGGRLALHRS
jgi:predicted nucleic acid-binding protein